MRNVTAFFVAILLIFTCSVPSFAAELPNGEETTTEHPETTEYPNDISQQPDLVSKSAIVMDVATGRILFEKNAYDRKYPASITKIMTVTLALEQNPDFSDTVTMSENAIWGVDRDSSLIGLDVGEKVSVGDLFYATMVNSANECAYALAEYVADDIVSFAKLMNQKAEEIGCQDTHFVTPNGLPDEDHYTTAYDMALITRYALQNDQFREIAGTLFYEVPSTNLTDETRPLWNGNKMINPSEPYYYEYCEGGKTGYTVISNNTLVTFAKKDGMELICVIMDCDGAKYAYTDSKALYNYCYNNYTYFYPLSDFYFESQEVAAENNNVLLDNFYDSLEHDLVDLKVDNNYSMLISKSMDTTKIEHSVILFDEQQSNALGEIQFTYEGEVLGSTPITTSNPHFSSMLNTEESTEALTFFQKPLGKVLRVILIIIASLICILALYVILSNMIWNAKHGGRRHKTHTNHRKRERKRKPSGRKKRDNDYYF